MARKAESWIGFVFAEGGSWMRPRTMCRLDRSSGPGCRLFKASDGVGTILASLGVAFRFLTSLVRRMRRL
jgi:hypothetical protein